MLATIATRLTDQLYFRCPLDPSRKAIYEYGIQLSLSTLASMCSIVMLGLLLKNPASAFIFLGVFFFLRLFSGGYHAPTYARCFLLTNSVYLAVVGTSNLIVRFQLYHLLPVIVVVSCVVVMALSPIRNKRHPLSEKTYRKNRKIAVVLVSIESSFFLILFFWRIFQPYVTVSTMSLTAVAVMMLSTLRNAVLMDSLVDSNGQKARYLHALTEQLSPQDRKYVLDSAEAIAEALKRKMLQGK